MYRFYLVLLQNGPQCLGEFFRALKVMPKRLLYDNVNPAASWRNRAKNTETCTYTSQELYSCPGTRASSTLYGADRGEDKKAAENKDTTVVSHSLTVSGDTTRNKDGCLKIAQRPLDSSVV